MPRIFETRAVSGGSGPRLLHKVRWPGRRSSQAWIPPGTASSTLFTAIPKTMQPYSSMSRTEEPRFKTPLGPYVLPLSSARVETLRRGQAFWQILADRQIPGRRHSHAHQLSACEGGGGFGGNGHARHARDSGHVYLLHRRSGRAGARRARRAHRQGSRGERAIHPACRRSAQLPSQGFAIRVGGSRGGGRSGT